MFSSNGTVCLISLVELLTMSWLENLIQQTHTQSYKYSQQAHVYTHTHTHTECTMKCEFIDCLSASHLLEVCSVFLTSLETAEHSTDILLTPVRHLAHSPPVYFSPCLLFNLFSDRTGLDRARWSSAMLLYSTSGQSRSQVVRQN